ncbi:MAG TPA: GNAT family N-acetyltransferase [Candidatus Saccharimonadales bacterium]|nr:GNAT family N-acetyltransferase [Candidatus Saccharimonadales bacterium]
MNNEIVIERVTTFSPEVAEAVRNLVKQLVPDFKSFTDDEFKEMIEPKQNFLFIARKVSTNTIAGVVMICIYRIPDSKKAYLDDIIVDEQFRGRGIASLLFEKIHATAKEHNAEYIMLTSSPQRVAAISLYEKLGFKKRGTNVYRLDL